MSRDWLSLTVYSQQQYYEDFENFFIYLTQEGLIDSQDVLDPAFKASTNCGEEQVGISGGSTGGHAPINFLGPFVRPPHPTILDRYKILSFEYIVYCKYSRIRKMYKE